MRKVILTLAKYYITTFSLGLIKLSQMLVNILVTNMMPIFAQAAENISLTLFIIFCKMLKGASWKDYITLSSYFRLIFSNIFFEGI